ncbi:MGMT family protein [Streptomyces sp. RTd22]|uniref:MGMT family protein n=1 Tax=Streptomyces sp. RTd22 TaxID=1841249 RepID=UPI0007C5BBE0|nr:MGMT family protein [Streptomyces sp. RTd22]
MNYRNDEEERPAEGQLEHALADLAAPAPADFALRVLQRVGIPRERYDTYSHLDSAAGGLYVAYSPDAVTGSAVDTMVTDADEFERLHHARTGRTAIRASAPFPGLRPALRTGRAKRLPIDLGGLTDLECAVLHAVRSIPSGQLRPITWLAREASLPSAAGPIVKALAKNPVPVLIPCHRVTYEGGAPCDAAYAERVGDALRSAEGIDMHRLEELTLRGAVFLGSDTTRIYCHPTCAHARRITRPHQVPFRTAGAARQAGYRACKSCRPATV